MNYYLSNNYKTYNSAGNKAKTDIEQIMSQNGFQNIGLDYNNYSNKIYRFLVTLIGVLRVPFVLNPGDRFVLQYPLKKYFTFLCKVAHWRKAKVIVIIHDLGSFRRKRLTPSKEIIRLSHSDYIVAHNENMKQWLVQNGCQVPIGLIGIFDYLSESQPQPSIPDTPPYTLVYAGALRHRKNKFLYDLGEHISGYRFELYGNGFELEKAGHQDRIKYNGFMPSDQLIESVQGHFGLVWDGMSIDSCTGDFGEYLQYNNPHKTSLYIRCGLPVIIWNKAALKPFVEKHGIGFGVDSLQDLNDRLQNMDKEKYAQMKTAVTKMSEKLKNGYFVSKAIRDGLQALE